MIVQRFLACQSDFRDTAHIEVYYTSLLFFCCLCSRKFVFTACYCSCNTPKLSPLSFCCVQGNYNPYAAGSWPEHPPTGASTAYPYAPQPPQHYGHGMPPHSHPAGPPRFSGTPPPHGHPHQHPPFGPHGPPHPHPPPPGAPLPMMTHMELYASTFFPGYPPHVQQLLARQVSFTFFFFWTSVY